MMSGVQSAATSRSTTTLRIGARCAADRPGSERRGSRSAALRASNPMVSSDGRKRHRAARRDQAIGRLPGGDAAAMRRNAERASGVRSERDRDRAARDRRRRTGRRSAGHVIEAPWIPDPSARGIEAGRLVGELGHLGEADPNRAGRVQPVQQIAVADDAEIARAGEPAARLVCRRPQHVLGGVGHAVQRAGRDAAAPARSRRMRSAPHRAPRRARVRSPASAGARPHRAKSNRECGASGERDRAEGESQHIGARAQDKGERL